ncbi:hypothetical protein KAU09_02850 [Candidatus Parcubacteria bacterium]|nr:hypothetical protein [Candidatus Parcubacteria bacterium]
MIIQITKIPDIPIFDKLDKQILKEILGFKLQTAPFGVSYNKPLCSRRTATDNCVKEYIVEINNLLAAAYEKGTWLYDILKSTLSEIEETDGIVLSPEEVKEI